MRRSIAIAVVLLGLAAPACGVLGGGALAEKPAAELPSHASVSGIVCPLRAGVVDPCCGPIVAQASAVGATGTTGVTGPIGCCTCCVAQSSQAPAPSASPGIATLCCPPTAVCAAPLTISSTPNPAPHDAAITISGRISVSSDPTVTLWQELPGRTKFSQLATTMANASDTYSFKIPAGRASTDRSWYVTNGTEQSSTDDELVEAKVTANDYVLRGGYAVVTGQVTPAHAGDQVLIERRAGAQWNIVAKATLSKRSRFQVPVAITGRGRVALRVHLPADSVNTDSFSRTLRFTVG